MKTTFYSLALLALTIAAASAADEKELPPGLRKKDKLPPGWEKKVGKDAETGKQTVTTATNTVNTTKSVVSDPKSATPATPAVTSPVVSAPAPKSPLPAKARSPQEVKASFEKNVRNVNTLDNQAPARAAGFAAISKETGVPVATIQKQHREHEAMGSAGLLMANLIAAQTKKPAGNFLRQREAGKSWVEIAAEHKVSLDSADASLNRVETAMRAAK
jgi:hypothetical protein